MTEQQTVVSTEQRAEKIKAELGEVETERRNLAYRLHFGRGPRGDEDSPQGRARLTQRLDILASRRTGLLRQLNELRLAEEEDLAIAAELEEAARQQERREKSKKLQSLARGHLRRSKDIEEATRRLCDLIRKHQETDRFTQVDPTLTQQAGLLDVRRYLPDWVSNQLAETPGSGRLFNRAPELYGRPLSEIEGERLQDLVNGTYEPPS